jgi:hypothetical protein
VCVCVCLCVCGSRAYGLLGAGLAGLVKSQETKVEVLLAVDVVRVDVFLLLVLEATLLVEHLPLVLRVRIELVHFVVVVVVLFLLLDKVVGCTNERCVTHELVLLFCLCFSACVTSLMVGLEGGGDDFVMQGHAGVSSCSSEQVVVVIIIIVVVVVVNRLRRSGKTCMMVMMVVVVVMTCFVQGGERKLVKNGRAAPCGLSRSW